MLEKYLTSFWAQLFIHCHSSCYTLHKAFRIPELPGQEQHVSCMWTDVGMRKQGGWFKANSGSADVAAPWRLSSLPKHTVAGHLWHVAPSFLTSLAFNWCEVLSKATCYWVNTGLKSKIVIYLPFFFLWPSVVRHSCFSCWLSFLSCYHFSLHLQSHDPLVMSLGPWCWGPASQNIWDSPVSIDIRTCLFLNQY